MKRGYLDFFTKVRIKSTGETGVVTGITYIGDNIVSVTVKRMWKEPVMFLPDEIEVWYVNA